MKVYLFLLLVITSILAEECKNKFQSCWNLDSTECFGNGREWMKENCAAKCGYCKDTSLTCADKIETCKEIPQICTTPEYEGWARTNCRKHCGLCSDEILTSTTTSIRGTKFPRSDCFDKRDDCNWMDDSLCYNSVIVEYCPKRCGKCEDENMSCSDAIDYCHKLEKEMCTRTENQGWARTNCRKYCNLCAAPTTTTIESTTTAVPYVPDPSPTDGKWSYWDSWSQCTATCGSGTRTRQRKCNSPPPLNGGRNCTGIQQESESCNMFECPDCDRFCPWGGHLSKDCSMCVCSNTILFGMVTDENNHPVDGVEVFLNIKQWEPFAKTNAFGSYVGKEICLMGEDILFKKNKYKSVLGQPIIMNRTHWQLDASLQSLATPRINIHPKDKARMEGQSVTLCCKAVGRPQPAKYKWSKNGENISGGQNGNLYLGNLKIEDSGKYTCRVDTVAGTAFSREAVLTVQKLSQDSCDGAPEENQVDLPEGCHYDKDGIISTTVNIKQCKKGLCVNSTMRNTGSCEDPWQRHCCLPKAVEEIDIQCDGFSYQMNRVISCQCSACATLTQISGSAYGIQNRTIIPYSYGEIYIANRRVGLTSSTGYFIVSFEPNTTSVVLELKNDRDRKFMSTLKTVEITEDQNTPVDIVVPLKPKPHQFHSNEGLYSIPLGSKNDEPPAIHMSIPQNSIIKKDGTPYDGLANVSIHFMDPRNLDDIKSAYGSLTYVDEHGNDVPLDTYGMFELNIEDHQGNELLMNSPVKVEMDTSVMNVSVDENGNPDLYSWYLNPETGKWVELEQFKFKRVPVGNRRRLLQDKSLIIEGFFPTNIKDIDIIERGKTKYNGDKKAKFFYELDYRENTNKRFLNTEACVVRIKTYVDTTFKKVLTGSGVTVTAYTKNGNKYTGAYSSPVNKDGIACLYILCHQEVQIHANQTTDPIDLVASNKHSLPPGMSFSNLQRHRVVSFNARVNGYQFSTKKMGPVFQFLDKDKCKWRKYLSNDSDDYHFQFAPLVKSPDVKIKEKDTTSKPLSWYPAEKDKQTRRACFIKVVVLGNETSLGSVRVRATSYQNSSFSTAKSYGFVEVGALPDLSRNTVDFGELGACLEIRCPGQVKNESTIINDIPTSILVGLTFNGSKCLQRPNNMLAKRAYKRYLRPLYRTNSFQLMLSPNDNYGPITGVYMYNGVSDTVRNFCLSGRDTDPVSNTMKINKQTSAWTFDCR